MTLFLEESPGLLSRLASAFKSLASRPLPNVASALHFVTGPRKNSRSALRLATIQQSHGQGSSSLSTKLASVRRTCSRRKGVLPPRLRRATSPPESEATSRARFPVHLVPREWAQVPLKHELAAGEDRNSGFPFEEELTVSIVES